MWNRKKCLGCMRCVYACRESALCLGTEKMQLQEASCSFCGDCTAVCPGGALTYAGMQYEAEKLVGRLLRDKVFYDVSGGGVTFSGGEPLIYPEYVGKTAELLKEKGIDICVETCGFFDFSSFFQYVLPYTDRIYFDIKLMSPELHRKHTGQDNCRILDNFVRLCGEKIDITPRTPLVPGITDTEENLAAIHSFLRRHRMEKKHVLLPYNSAGEMKRERLL